MSPEDACLLSNHVRHAGRSALHMAVWAHGRMDNQHAYAAFLNDLCNKARA